MKITNKTKTFLCILIFFTLLYGVQFISQSLYKLTSYITNSSHQLAEASNLYNEPYISPEILLISPSPDARYNIRDELSISFSISDTSFITEADIDGRRVENGEMLKVAELAIGKHTLTVKAVANSPQNVSLGAATSDTTASKEVTFTVVPLVGIKGLIGEDGDFVNFIISTTSGIGNM